MDEITRLAADTIDYYSQLLEEREDFRQRLDLTLHFPGKEWPGIDPVGWVIERQYYNQNFGETIQKFLQEREKSIKWLKSLSSPNWDAQYEHPKARKHSLTSK